MLICLDVLKMVVSLKCLNLCYFISFVTACACWLSFIRTSEVMPTQELVRF